MSDSKCLSTGEVLPGEWKRCQREPNHDGKHRWVEDATADGKCLVAQWTTPTSVERRYI